MGSDPTPYTLITGASRGIGKAMAEEAAARGQNVALVALPGEDLPSLAAELTEKYGISTQYLELDLSHRDAAEAVYNWVLGAGFQVNILVNNAGFGTLGALQDGNLAKDRVMLDLNMDAPYLLIRYFLPMLLAQKEAYILNNASQAAYFPIPLKATYAATKAFLFYISLALHHELRNSNVHVSCLCPSGVATNEVTRARIQSAGFMSRMASMEPEDIAQVAFKGLYRKKRLIIPGFLNKATYYLGRIMPIRLSMSMAEKRFRKEG